MQQLRVSVVIPTYNRSAELCRAVRSVLDQTYPALEVIIIDDGSSDDTAQRVAEIRDDRVRFSRFANAGVAAARNRGVRLARGEFLAFLDSDDSWKPQKVATDVAFLDAHTEVAAVFTDLEKLHGGCFYSSFARESPAFAPILQHMNGAQSRILERDECLICLLQEVPIKPSAFTIRTSVFTQLGGFDESLRSSEDWEFFLRLAREYRLGYVDRPLAVLRISHDSLHLLAADHGWEAAWRFLKSARQSLGGDKRLQAAAKVGLVNVSKHLGWHYRSRGRRLQASGAQLRGFAHTGALGLLVRSVHSLLPTRARMWGTGVRTLLRRP